MRLCFLVHSYFVTRPLSEKDYIRGQSMRYKRGMLEQIILLVKSSITQ
jgi:hypothetical protein